MIQNVSKKHWVTHELQGTVFNEQRELILTTQKKGFCVNGKKIWKSLLGKKHLLEKPVHFSIKSTANNADTWGLIQQFFPRLYRTANSNGHHCS